MGVRLLTFLALAALLAACAPGGGIPGTVTPTGTVVGGVTEESLRTAGPRVDVAGKTVLLETYLWRDFMPGPATAPSGLRGTLTVKTTDGSPVPQQLKVDRAWFLLKGETWSVDLTDAAGAGAGGPELVRTVRNGPEWEPGARVVVVVRLVDGSGGSYLVRAPEQAIERTS